MKNASLSGTGGFLAFGSSKINSHFCILVLFPDASL